MGHLVENIVREIQPDIVNCHNLAGFSSAVWPAIKRAGPPIVQVLHDLYSVCPNSNMFHHGQSCQSQCIKCKIFRIPHKKLSNHVDCVIGVSNYVLQKHITEGYFLHSKIKKYLHNVKPFIYAKNMVFVKNNYITFGFIGNLSKAKGIELLLSSFASIKNKNSAKLIVAGKGNDDYLKYLKIQDLDNVTYIGYVDPIVLFSKIDVLVVPSLWNDTFPSVILESLLYGKPVIGSCLGGIPEIIEDGINGLIFNPNCVFDLRDKIDLLINDNQKLERLKLAAVDSYKDMMDFDEWLESYIRTFSCFLNAY
jgi:glycosyltransferase involved in cell wall biosynthesis